MSGQAGAIGHGISRALVNFDPSLGKNLKKQVFLLATQEKLKRIGKQKRRSPQFSKDRYVVKYVFLVYLVILDPNCFIFR